MLNRLRLYSIKQKRMTNAMKIFTLMTRFVNTLSTVNVFQKKLPQSKKTTTSVPQIRNQ